MKKICRLFLSFVLVGVTTLNGQTTSRIPSSALTRQARMRTADQVLPGPTGTISLTEIAADSTLKDGEKIELLGYHSRGDGGGQLVVWREGDTTSSDGGFVIIVSANGRFHAANKQVAEVTKFGTLSHVGTATGGAAATVTLRSEASVHDDAYNTATITITAGEGIGQTRTISDYTGSTRVATVSAWTTEPDTTSVYELVVDDTVRIQAAVDAAAGGGVALFTNYVFGLSDQIDIASDTTLRGDSKAQLKQTATDTTILAITDADNVVIEKLSLFGLGTDYAPTANPPRRGVYILKGTNIRVRDCLIQNVGGPLIQTAGLGVKSRISVTGNELVGVSPFGTATTPGGDALVGVLIDGGTTTETDTATTPVSSTTVTLGSSASATPDYYIGWVITNTGGGGTTGDVRTVTDYSAAKLATVNRAWTTNPDATTSYSIVASTGQVTIADNQIHDVGTGIATALAVHDVTIVGNVIMGCEEEHGMYLQSPAGLSVTGNVVDTTNYQGIKLQLGATAVEVDGRGVIANNSIFNSGDHGLLLTNTGGVGDAFMSNLSVTGNAIVNAGSDGVNMTHCENVVVANNTIANATRYGINMKHIRQCKIQGNNVRSAGQIGITTNEMVSGLLEYVEITGNTVLDSGSLYPVTRCGIYHAAVTGVEELTISDNVIADTRGTSESAAITAITQANPAVVTSASHGYSNGDSVVFESIGGMTELNNTRATIANVTANTFEIAGVDSTAFTLYTSGGNARKGAVMTYAFYTSGDQSQLRLINNKGMDATSAGIRWTSAVIAPLEYRANSFTGAVAPSISPPVNDHVVVLAEQSTPNAEDVAGFGQIWVKDTTPAELWFTDDAGTDTQLGAGGGGGSPAGSGSELQYRVDASTFGAVTGSSVSGGDVTFAGDIAVDIDSLRRFSVSDIGAITDISLGSAAWATHGTRINLHAGYGRISHGSGASDLSIDSAQSLHLGAGAVDGTGTAISIDAAGLVGINDTSPDAQLDIVAGSASTVGQIIELAATPTANAFEINTNGGANGDIINVQASGRLTFGDSTATSPNSPYIDNNAGSLRFYAHGGLGRSFEFTSAVANFYGLTSWGNDIVFNTNNGNTDFEVRGDTLNNLLFVDASADKVGINDPTPDAQLDLVAGSASTVGLIVEAAAAQTANLLEINSTGASGGDLFHVASTGVPSSTGGQTGSEVYGLGASVTDTNSVAFGAGATVSATGPGIAIGAGATCRGFSVAIGDSSGYQGYNAVVGMNITRTNFNYQTGLGYGVRVREHSISLGNASESTASNQLVAGSSTSSIDDVYFGEGVVDATPTAYTIHGTGGSGTDIAGADIQIAGGIGTGTGVGGDIVFQSAPASTTSSSANTLVTILSVNGDTVSTTDATETTCGTIATASDTAYHVTATIIGRETDDSDEVASYQLQGTFRNDGGTLAVVGSVSTVHSAEDTAGWDATLDVSGTDVRARVTGAAATNANWITSFQITEL